MYIYIYIVNNANVISNIHLYTYYTIQNDLTFSFDVLKTYLLILSYNIHIDNIIPYGK